MTVAIIGIAGVPANYGGFESLVENLLDEDPSDQNSLGEVMVFCSGSNYKDRIATYKNARLVYLPMKANGASSIFYDIYSIFYALRFRASCLLILGVSGCICLPLVRLLFKGKIVVNIDGIEWRREKWGTVAKRFLKLSEKIAVLNSDVVISDNQVIANYVSREYGKESSVIAYGGDHSIALGEPSGERRYALALCRVEPENNCHIILKAFEELDEKLVFVGNWNASFYGRELKSRYANYDNITLVDPVYEASKLFTLRCGAWLYVHGHSAGGTNPSLVEMMFFSIPIICYDCGFNRETTKNIAHYFQDEAELAEKVSSMSNNKRKYLFEATQLRVLADRMYTWDLIKKRYYECIKE